MRFLAKVNVTLKEGVLDPQGDAVRKGLNSMGYQVQEARVGRLIELTLEGEDKEAARRHVEEMCRRLLANPVTEEFVIDSLEEV